VRVKTEKASRGFGFGDIPIVGVGGFDYKKKDTKVVAECGVDLKLVNPTTGKVDASHFGEFKRIDSIGAFGIEILGASSDHLITDSGQQRLSVGAEVRFRLDYSALMRAMTSPFVAKVMLVEAATAPV